ncbi:uncharacterized protein LOC134274122 isoform X2 [Saccostrea cucullata]|uniref:uncharacterized protein LOC134274122 isoform X2 n=1 Tax=Saccostrea cuccullata TaxID=36930 RepID=UPI002ED5216D
MEHWILQRQCLFGSFGQNCTGKCKSGFYGRLCTTSCSCEAERCNRVNGCPKELTTSMPKTKSVGLTVTLQQTLIHTPGINQEMVEESSGTSTQRAESLQNKFTKHLLMSLSNTFTENHVMRTTQHKRRERRSSRSVSPNKATPRYQVISTPNQEQSSFTNEENHWMLTSILLIILISIAFIGGISIYLHSSNKCPNKVLHPFHLRHSGTSIDHTTVNIQHTNENVQDTDTIDSEGLGDYDEIRQSQFNQCSSTTITSNLSVYIRKTNDASGNEHLPTHSLYEKISFHIDYHVLQFREKQNFASPDYLFGESKLSSDKDDEYVCLRSSRSLDLQATTEDLILHNDSHLLDISKKKSEKTEEHSNKLLRSFSEGQIANLKNLPKSIENNLISTEEDFLFKESFKEAERPYSVIHNRKSKQENL